jgi:hypothetical protein
MRRADVLAVVKAERARLTDRDKHRRYRSR